jgi:hypothetical protein
MKQVLLACALALGGCVPTTFDVKSSSLDYVPPTQSGATSTHSPVDAAREVTRLFELRGFALADEHVVEVNGVAMKFASHSQHRSIGSVFYAWVQPAQDGGSMITMFGRPTLDGAEPCTTEQPALSCSGVSVANPDWAASALSGRAEADVVHGVVSELGLEGFATGPLPAIASVVPDGMAATDPSVCEAQRQLVFAQAATVADSDQRGRILQSAPVCGPVAQVAN